MEVLAAELTDAGTIRFTLAHAGGLTPLEGAVDEIDRLTAAMKEVALLASAADGERCWLHAVTVGDCVVKLGLAPGGGVRLLVSPR